MRAAPDGALFVGRCGVQPFAIYLCTRTVEFVVHTVDICETCRLATDIPEPAARITRAVMAEAARRSGWAPDVLHVLGSRGGMPPGFNVFR